MKTIHTQGIVLARTNYGEADRIIVMLTPDQGKLRVIARGVRKVKSKLAGGIELFSVSDISFIRGKSDLCILVGARLFQHYENIVSSLNRTMLAYDLAKQLNKVTEDEPGSEYFNLLRQSFVSLNNKSVDCELIKSWFNMQLILLSGHKPNLLTDVEGKKLSIKQRYFFNFEKMSFYYSSEGNFDDRHIKFLRLGFGHHEPNYLQLISGVEKLLADTTPLIQDLLETNLST